MLSANMRGSLFMALAMAVFTFNDSIVKLISDTLPIPQIIFLRGILTTILIVAMIHIGRKPFLNRDLRRPVIWWRAALEIGATYTFLTGLKHVPIANAAAILSTLPLAVTIGSALIFKEPVGWRRWLAIVIGFCGVLLIVKPGVEGFNTYSSLILVSIAFSATRDLLTRRAPADIPSLVFTLSTSIAITVTGGLFVLASGDFAKVDVPDATYLLAAAIFLTIGYYFIVSAMRMGEISIVAPFRYTYLIWAIIIGITIFDDPLEWTTIVGSIIIVSMGIFTFYRERVLALNRDRERRIPQGR